MPVKKMLATKAIKLIISIYYSILCVLFKINPKKITFASYRASRLEGNLKYTFNELEKTDYPFHYSFLFKKYNTSFIGKLDYILHMLKACYHLATSRYFIIDDYYFPVYLIIPRGNMEVIQLWHAAGAFKKFGYSIVDKYGGASSDYLDIVPVHANYSKVLVSGKHVIPFFSEAFNMASSRIFPLGLPRTDLLFDKDEHARIKGRFYQQFPNMKGKEIILYAPTFRGKSHYQAEYTCPINLDKLFEEISEDYSLIIHLHPYMNNTIMVKDSLKDRIITKIEDFTINELLIVSDLLITDYSSVIFEYSLLKKPMLFYCYDLVAYMEERDFYLNYKTDLPGPMAYTTEDIVRWVLSPDKNMDKVKAFSDKFFDHQDGHAAKRVVGLLLEGMITEQSGFNRT